MTGTGAAVSIKAVEKAFGGTPALRGVSLECRAGEFVSLLGPSGCGKTSLLRIIGGFLDADAGEVWVGGERIDGRPPNRRPVNTVFQSYALFSHKSVAGNVAFPLEVAKVPKAERAERVAEMLDLVRLGGFGDRPVSALSGGQAQRVALARALVAGPQVLLLDEPLAALDLKLRKAMQLELCRIHEKLGTTFIYVTHDQEEALTMSDRVVLMNQGEISQEGAPQEIYDRPSNSFASDFLGEANLIPATVVSAAGGRASVVVGGTEITATTATDAIDAAAAGTVLSVRPERISLDPTSEHVSVPGTVQRVVFLGHALRVLVALEDGEVITAQVPRGENDRLRDGERLRIGWRADAAVLMQRPEDA